MPQLVGTAQRSRKTGDTALSVSTSDKTEVASGDDFICARKARILGISPMPPNNTPTADFSCNPLFLEIKRSASPLVRRRSYFSSSQHSFRVPDLDPIESSGSEASGPPSPTTASPSTKCDTSVQFEQVAQRQESEDERASGHLLEIAAKAAERQLREQAMAAFPNSEDHARIDHYIDHDLDELVSCPDEMMSRRESSFNGVNWELEAMRKYQEKQAKDKEQQKEQEALPNNSSQAKAAPSLSENPAGLWTAKKAAGESDPELERMRKQARPPMLGKNIKFPRCASPEPSRFDPTQGCDIVRTTMCYLSEQSKAAEEKGESLWCGKGNGKQTSKTPSLWSSGTSRTSSTHGLWGGFCSNGGDKSPRGPTGILTPSHDKGSPFSPYPTPAMSLLPPTPPSSAADFSSINEKLAVEQTIIEDFGDDFVTQVYNYLSLGYPSMARPFDAELSKISKIPISELRQDDHLAASRGYIRLGKDGNLTDSEITEETCVRWRALRLYIQEWARQNPGMAEEEIGRGTAVRKGSWAL